MKTIFSDFKKGIIKLKITSPEDLWYLSQIIEAGDAVSGKTVRKVTIGSAEGRTTHTQKQIFLKITVERIELTQDTLRVSGKITEGPEDISRGSYHTFTLEKNTECSIQKQEWLSHHKAQLKEAAQTTNNTIIICVFDRDDAVISRSRQWGVEILTRLRGDPEKKEKRANTKTDLYKDIIKSLQSYNERFNPQYIILASPAFYKEDVHKQITDKELRKKIILATCSSAGENAIHEVLKRPETQHAFSQMRVAHEVYIVEKLLAEIARQGNATYGFEQIKTAAEAGAISNLLITNALIKKYQAENKFKALNHIMKQVDKLRGTIHIISSEHDAGKKLDGLGGVAAILRYKMEW